jgi:hypothetical protein
MDNKSWDLPQAITALRADLQQAISEGTSEEIQFDVGDIELTLQLVVTTKADGKIGWSVLGVGAGREADRSHAVKLTLRPHHAAADGATKRKLTITGQSAGEPQFGDLGN